MHDSRIRVAQGALLAVGVTLRIAPFINPRPLWLDEALLAQNILTRSPGELLQPLGAGQVSPVGFVWAEWLMTQVAGTGERALRFLPLVAGIAALFAFARLVRRLLEPRAALLAIALAAVSPLLIYYSAEVKSYGFDALCAILMMLATLAVIDEPSPRAWMQWSAAAVFSVMFSTPSPFFVAGSAIALLAAPRVHRQRRELLRLGAAAVPSAAIFAMLLRTSYSSPEMVDFMRQSFTTHFLTPDQAGLTRAAEIAREVSVATIFGVEPLRKVMTVVLATALVGAVSLGRRSAHQALLILAPVLVAGAASMAKLWPLSPRLLLFAAPTLFITLSAGIDAISRVARKGSVPLFATMSFVLLALIGRTLPRALQPPEKIVAVPEALEFLGTHVKGGATLYVSADLSAACSYYHSWHPDRSRLRGDTSQATCSLLGVQTVPAQWSTDLWKVPGGVEARNRAWQDFAAREGQRILAQPATDIWVVVGGNQLQRFLPAWLEGAGVRRISEKAMRGLVILHYRPR